jgi:hypothetical protein
VGLEPIHVNVDRVLEGFRRGYEELGEIWSLTLTPENFAAVRRLGLSLCENRRTFHMDDDLWARIVLDFACAYKLHPVTRATMLGSMAPLYLARVASFVRETETLAASEVEQSIERLCLTFEDLKPYLIQRWKGSTAPAQISNANLEVLTHG